MFTEFEKGTKPVRWKPVFRDALLPHTSGSSGVLGLICLCVQFKPLEQLMGVFPAASGNFLPDTWRNLMSSPVSVQARIPFMSACTWSH